MKQIPQFQLLFDSIHEHCTRNLFSIHIAIINPETNNTFLRQDDSHNRSLLYALRARTCDMLLVSSVTVIEKHATNIPISIVIQFMNYVHETNSRFTKKLSIKRQTISSFGRLIHSIDVCYTRCEHE